MKKTLTILLAVILAATFALSAFASETPSKESVLKEIDSTVDYIADGISGYTVDSALDYYYLAKNSSKATSFYDAFLQSVKDNLAANSGKLVPIYGENATTYAAVIGIIDVMGGDPTNIDSVNLVELLENTDISTVSNPYYYNIVIPVAANRCDEQFVKSLCDSFIADYYTVGSGMNYWGFSCDNTAMFISAVAQSGLDCYDSILEDAVNILNTYKTDGGYCYNPEYGTAPNVNSTAFALMAKCEYYSYKGTAADNTAELVDLYEALLTFRGETDGSFAYDGVESRYSAADALKGLNSFYSVLPDNTPDTPEDSDNKPDTKPETPVKVPTVGGADKNPEIPNTDSEISVIFAGLAALSVIVATASLNKKKENMD
ncbi:MAG: hypothetical protein K2G60_03910 [Oscillospiraceae bacterium]|nr:hypothetical protein [Oscillospiraceae bacterium]